MTAKPLIVATLALFAGVAGAGVRIETVTRNIETKKADGAPQVVAVQGGAVRVTSKDGAMILRDNTIYVVDDKGKTYRELDKATLERYAKQMGSAMAKMQEQLKNMPPEQRAQVEKMMGGRMSGMASAQTDVYEAQDTGRRDIAEGRKCGVWNMLKNGAVYEELCVVPFSSLPGKEDVQQAFKRITEAFEGLASAFPNAPKDVKARANINGYPVRARSIADGKPTGSETVLQTWKEESFPASIFEVPAGYKKEDMPKLGG